MKRIVIILGLIFTVFSITLTVFIWYSYTETASEDSLENLVIEETIIYAESENINTDFYYYEQLTDFEKEIYNIIIQKEEDFFFNKPLYLITVDYNGDDEEIKLYVKSARRAFTAYSFDNPLAEMWKKTSQNIISAKPKTIDGKLKYDIYINPLEEFGKYADFEGKELTEMVDSVENKINEFVKTLPYDYSDLQKLVKIYEWIISDAKYDYSLCAPNTQDVYGAVIRKNATCSGYAKAFKAVADKAGLKVIYVTGKISGDIPHAWNYALLNGKWYLIDPTLAISSANTTKCFLNNNNIDFYLPSEKYFNCPKH